MSAGKGGNSVGKLLQRVFKKTTNSSSSSNQTNNPTGDGSSTEAAAAGTGGVTVAAATHQQQQQQQPHAQQHRVHFSHISPVKRDPRQHQQQHQQQQGLVECMEPSASTSEPLPDLTQLPAAAAMHGGDGGGGAGAATASALGAGGAAVSSSSAQPVQHPQHPKTPTPAAAAAAAVQPKAGRGGTTAAGSSSVTLSPKSNSSGGLSSLTAAAAGAVGSGASGGSVSAAGGTNSSSSSGINPSPGTTARTLAGSLGRRSVGALNLHSNYHSGGEAFKVRVGVCAMDRKAGSKPMREIINRLMAYGDFDVVTFGDETILNKPITEWPRVDCLMSWYSDGFPLGKAQAYADLTRPFLINDLNKQTMIQDRREVYRVLQDAGIAVPHHIVVNREGLEPGEDPPGFNQEEDYVELDGVRINKPFVEKPVSGEDHNIHIYYPCSMGGGVKRLFRKIDNKSSCYDPHHDGRVRTDGSYIYEEFLPTGGTDVKVYTVGPRYAHAEARKSPVVDGRVLRTPDGKEMRFPVLLNPAEKEISRTVCLAFGQKVCGFDLLRSEKGKSYVCDVNGWSFVKNSKKYLDDAAGILRRIILQALAPHRLSMSVITPGVPLSFSGLSLSPAAQLAAAAAAATSGAGGVGVGSVAGDGGGMGSKTVSVVDMASLCELSEANMLEATKTDERSTHEELRCVLAVVRHGDRTPKQKLKVRVRHPALLSLFAKHADSKGKQAKLKSPNQLQELLDISRSILQELEHPPPPGLSEEEVEAREETREKLRIVKTVLEQGGQFSGINRKVQLKPLTWAPAPSTTQQQQQQPTDSTTTAAAAAAAAAGDANNNEDASSSSTAAPAAAAAAVPAAADASQPQPAAAAADGGGSQQQQQQQQVLTEALLILKYGGVLTHAGRAQAEELGKVFRLVMYPNYGSTGGGLLRLHSTYRHDFKIYSSDEGRVQVAAAAFTKGLLDLEGSSLTPILVSLVNKDATMLDAFGKGASEDIVRSKQVLYNTMTWDPDTASSVLSVPNYRKHLYAACPSPLSTGGPSSGAAAGAAAPTGGPLVSPAGSNISRASSSGALQQQQQQQQPPPPPPALQSLAAAAAVAAAAGGGDGGDDGGGSGSNEGQQGSTGAAAQQQQGSAAEQQQQQQAMASAAAGGGGGVIGAESFVRKDIPHMPDAPLSHLRQLNELMRTLVEKLRELVLAEKRAGGNTTASSSAKELTGLPAAAAAAAAAGSPPPKQQQQQSSNKPEASADAAAAAAAAARAALVGPGPAPEAVPSSNPGSGNGTGPKTPSPKRPSTAPSAVGGGGGGGQQQQQQRSSSGGGSAAGAGGGAGGGGTCSSNAAATAAPALPSTASLSTSSSATAAAAARYSSLSCDPADWQLQEGRPCSGEALLLMFDRWQKLAKTFYKKGRFDISKVPDIYDSAKYDMLHNVHLPLSPTLEQLYREAKILADAVIPNEYGIDPQYKLAIGSKIATELLAKLLDDLRASKEESLATLTDAERSASAGSSVGVGGGAAAGGGGGGGGGDNKPPALGRKSMPHLAAAAARGGSSNGGGGSSEQPAAAAAAAGVGGGSSGGGAAADTAGDAEGSAAAGINRSKSAGASLASAAAAVASPGDATAATAAAVGGDSGGGGLSGHASGDEAEVEGFAGEGDGEYYFDDEPETMHRLCPTYASDINSPLRHVRTRIYFTSESHMHSLVNLLRFSNLRSTLLPNTTSTNSSSSRAASRRGSMDTAVGAAAAAAAGGGGGGGGEAAVKRCSSGSSASGLQTAANTANNSGSGSGEAATATTNNNNNNSSSSNATQQQQQQLSRCPTPPGPPPEPLLSQQGLALLSKTTELDYLTHLVFRLYENKSVPADHPLRFKLEILFSPGAAYDPTEVIPANHSLPPRPRVALHKQDGCTLTEVEKLLRPFAAKKKKQPAAS